MSDGSDDIFSDYITLGKSTEFETVVWRFPDTDQCPLKDCLLSCSSRSICLGHFHLMHADESMLCTICSELISIKNPLNLFRHYQDHHPNKPPPKLKPVSWILAITYFNSLRIKIEWCYLLLYQLDWSNWIGRRNSTKFTKAKNKTTTEWTKNTSRGRGNWYRREQIVLVIQTWIRFSFK